MKQGLVLGKFMPLHKGHIGLIDFAATKCDELVVLLCSDTTEPIDGSLRYKWLLQTFKNRLEIKVMHLEYNPEVLPNTSVSGRETSQLWANKISEILPSLDVIIGSEPYVEYVAGFLGIEHAFYDTGRNINPARGQNIMTNPFANWELISEAARPYFVKKVCLCGTESTGKTILCERLAKHFNTVFVPEAGRMIVPHSDSFKTEDVDKIAQTHAGWIVEGLNAANKVLFIDTDITITRSYASFLLDYEYMADEWVLDANKSDLYLYSTADAKYIQDGTRLPAHDRLLLDDSHRMFYAKSGTELHFISGSWDERFMQAISLVESLLGVPRKVTRD